MKDLDSTQYSRDSIASYESIYGEDFVSPGGKSMAHELICRMGMAPGSAVLDVGSGLGGSAFMMAREFDLMVQGIDISQNMVELAREKCKAYSLEDSVVFTQGDCLDLKLSEQFDAVYSRDVFLHIHQKPRLFTLLYNSLRPEGQLLFTDYCWGLPPRNPEFEAYVADRGYCLHTLDEYQELVRNAGFTQIECEDLSAKFVQILRSEMITIQDLDIAESLRSKLTASWQSKLAHCETGHHRWGLIRGVKPGC